MRTKTGKTRSRRPVARKPTMAKAKRMVAGQKKRQYTKNMDTFYLKAKIEGVANPVQGATVANYLSMWFPLLSATAGAPVTNNAEFKLYQGMYDRVRINSVKLTLKPKANVLDLFNAQNDGILNATGSGVYHHVVDRDDQPPASIPRLSRYPSYKRTSVLKPMTRTYSIKYPTSVWLDAQNIFSDTTLLSRLGLAGGIYVYAENILEDNNEIFNEPFCEYMLEYGCVFQGKTQGNLSYDSQTGVVSIAPTQPAQIVSDTYIVTSGTFNDRRIDASGNLVAVTDTSTP